MRMIPGMNPKAMEQAMKKMGIKQQHIDAEEVVIRCADRDIVISRPDVSKVNMMGQETFQITGDALERKRTEEQVVEITDDDIKAVMDQAKVSEDEAFSAIEKTGGDLAEAIMLLQGSKDDSSHL